MLYFRCKVSFGEKVDIESKHRFRGNKLSERIKSETCRLNENRKICFYVTDVESKSAVICGIAQCDSPEDVGEEALKFATGLGFKKVKVTECDEITLKTALSMLRRASNEDYIDDMSDIIDLPFRYGSLDEYIRESVVGPKATKKDIRSKAVKMNFQPELGREIDRIFKPGTVGLFGHPVHYAIAVDDAETAEDVCKLLVSALYHAKRLKSRRITFVKTSKKNALRNIFIANEDFETDALGAIYNVGKGGTFVLNVGKLQYESEVADSDMINIDDMADVITGNRRECLTILTFSKGDVKSYERLRMKLPGIRFVELKEEMFFRDTALEILAEKAKADNVGNCDSLLAKVADGEKGYYMSDVREMYDEWMDEILPVELFPQYKDIRLPEKKVDETVGNAYEEFRGLIGLDNVKEIVEEAISFNKFNKMYSEMLPDKTKPSRHMVFAGNPGTAKTTVARLFAQIMKDNKVLSKGKLIEVGRQDLVGKYVGWTAPKVEEVFRKAAGSVLFIDEAYSLCDDRDGSYGDEAINAIVQMMENNRDETIVVFAGYPDKMEAFLNKNPGLRSRIAFHVNFDDYSESELLDILKLMAKGAGITLGDGVEEKAREIFSSCASKRDFGNGRFVRNVFERAKMRQACRVVAMDQEKVDAKVMTTLVADDFVMPDSVARETCPERRIGFAG